MFNCHCVVFFSYAAFIRVEFSYAIKTETHFISQIFPLFVLILQGRTEADMIFICVESCVTVYCCVLGLQKFAFIINLAILIYGICVLRLECEVCAYRTFDMNV